MKRLPIILLLLIIINSANQAQTVTIGTGTSTQRQPFGCWWGYERSAAIYTAAEIGTTGTIATLAWNVGTSQTTSIPTKIYLKTTTSTTTSADTWTNMISGATLVYDASTSFPSTGWTTIDITDFTYSSNNLLVLCETNYTGTGTSNYPYFYYTTTGTSLHEYWYADNAVPTGNGTTNTSRPNIRLNFISCGAGISSLPWTEGFEGLTIPAFPSCWYKENGDWVTTNNANSTYDADAHAGNQFLRDSWSATNEYIWTPGFNLTAGNSYSFSFWWAGDTYAGWTGDVFYNTTQVSTGATQMGTSFVANATTTTKTYAQVTRTFTPTVSGMYYFAIRVNCPTTTPWYLSFDDFRLEETNMIVPASGNNSYTACSQYIYDHAGPVGDYSNSAEGYSTIYPATAGNVVRVSGTSAGESCCDYVAIYNGVGTGGTLIGTYYMGTAIPEITSTDATGALTIRFHSDGSIVGAGFNIAISCVPPCITPGAPTNLTATVTGNSTATLAWTAGTPAGSSYYFTVYNASDNSIAIPATNVSGTSTSLSGLDCGKTYYYTVYAFNSCGNLVSSIVTSGNFTTATPTAAALPFTEGFNAMPECWGKDYLVGTSSPTISSSSSYPTTVPQEGTGYLYWNSWSITDGNETRFYSPPLSTMGTSSPEVRFFWMNENSTSYNSGTYLLEGVQVQYSTDKVNWIDVVFVPRYDATLASGTAQWKIKEIVLPIGASNQPAIYVGLKFHSSYGDNCSLDNLWVGQRYTDPLPVELISFTGTCNSDLVSIDWTTATETNNDYFTIERSVNSIDWEFVQQISGAGNSNQPLNYSISIPAASDYKYYRLKQTDYNGESETFPPIAIECQNYSNIRVYPNPTSNRLNIDYQDVAITEIEVTDMIGQIILKVDYGLNTIDLSDFPSGVYSLRVKYDQDKTSFFKIIKE